MTAFDVPATFQARHNTDVHCYVEYDRPLNINIMTDLCHIIFSEPWSINRSSLMAQSHIPQITAWTQVFIKTNKQTIKRGAINYFRTTWCSQMMCYWCVWEWTILILHAGLLRRLHMHISLLGVLCLHNYLACSLFYDLCCYNILMTSGGLIKSTFIISISHSFFSFSKSKLSSCLKYSFLLLVSHNW